MIDWQSKVIAPVTGAFGQPASITWGGQAVPLNGVFDEAYAQVEVAEGLPITTLRPCLGINLGDISLAGQPTSALQGSRLTVFASPFAGGAPAVDTDYIVREAQTDGHGWARLMLNLAPVSGDEPVGGGQDA